jgi:hypothetical protein
VKILKNLQLMVQGFVKQHFFELAKKGVSCGDTDISADLSNFNWHLSLESSRN